VALGLPFYQEMFANLADGSHIKVDVHKATILWDGRAVQVAVLAMGRRPLLGTALLDGYNLNADFEDHGALALQHL
jgi:clan AA aspartic protease